MSWFDIFRVPQQLNRIERKIDALTEAGRHIMAAIDDLETSVTAINDAEAAAEALLVGLNKQLQDAINSGDATRVQAAADQLKTKAAALAAAVVANTPAAPTA